MPPDPSAAPARDWTARVTAECYRPISERDTLDHASWNLGPTLTAYLSDEAPDVLAGFRAPTSAGATPMATPGIAQSFHHAILPLAAMHDRRTEVRWGLRDFEHRFGRPAVGLWLPETAADLATLRILAEEGVRATILAPWQADTGHLESRPYRVDTGRGHVDVLFYDAGLSSSVSFEPDVTADADRFARERIAPHLAGRLDGGGVPVVSIASDGELYGHHQSFRDLFLDRLVAPEGDPRTAASTSSRWHGRPGSMRGRHTRRSGSASAPRGAATTACCAGRASARVPMTAAGRRRSARPSSGSPAPSTP